MELMDPRCQTGTLFPERPTVSVVTLDVQVRFGPSLMSAQLCGLKCRLLVSTPVRVSHIKALHFFHIWLLFATF